MRYAPISMPRTARASVGDMCYHVLKRGNARAEVFHKAADYQAFLDLIAEACNRLPATRDAPAPDWLSALPRNWRWRVNQAESDPEPTALGLESSLRPRGLPRKDEVR